MEVIFSAILGELASRSIYFLVDKYLKQMAAPSDEERLDNLRRLLLRVRIIVDEAEDRHITNQVLLHQLIILKKEMYRGYYIADRFSSRAHGEERSKTERSQAFATSKFNPAKRVCSQSYEAEMLEEVLGSVKNSIESLSEFVVFLNSCPRLSRQPYSVYLVLNKCMFNRQMEMEHIMNFLMQADLIPGAQHPGVLPIIGPGRVGKSTLIEHVCEDERVHSHFSQIVCFSGNDLKDASAETLRDRGIIKHQNHATNGGRTLIIIELVLDIDDCVWRRLFLSARSRISRGSKIIITSRSENVARFGTTQAIRVRFFTQEAYWYFFKVRTFGSMDTEDHPELAAIAMDMAREMDGCFMGANIFSEILKSKFNPHFWSMALAGIRQYKQKNMLLHGPRFLVDQWQLVEPIYVRNIKRTCSDYFVILDNYQTYSAQRGSAQSEAEAPKISVQDLFFGSVKPQGKFKVLAVRSHLPPYYNYMFNCETRRP